MDIVIYVILDQLGLQDAAQFPRLSALLGPPDPATVPYFPTVTETAHASFAVCSSPADHGVIGAGSAVGRSGIGFQFEEIDENVFSPSGCGYGKPFIVELASKGVECLVVAGKRKVAQLLCPRPLAREGVTRIWPDIEESRWNLVKPGDAKPPLPRFALESLKDPETDALLIEAARMLLEHKREIDLQRYDGPRPCFLFLGSVWK
jgi:hypothetical protein